MGTWGAGPFESDSAEDLLDELEGTDSEGKLDRIIRIMNSAVRGDMFPEGDLLPEEIIAVAAIVALNVSPDMEGVWESEVTGLAGWLPKPVTPPTMDLAIQALAKATPLDGWWSKSWVDESERSEAMNAISQIREKLQSATQS
ncbi:DUF4259 domain-containing protein [Nonomuraea sp. NPDC050540]|uniref:DUF4259 domain-containing protein n=1 Tax=Nonomuraea sp. NPDC050540 TaxID=3364367 RepID=UPI00378E5109